MRINNKSDLIVITDRLAYELEREGVSHTLKIINNSFIAINTLEFFYCIITHPENNFILVETTDRNNKDGIPKNTAVYIQYNKKELAIFNWLFAERL